MQKTEIGLTFILFFGVAAVFVGVGVVNHGLPWGWGSLLGGMAAVLVAYRGLR